MDNRGEKGAAGYIAAWAFGVPIPSITNRLLAPKLHIVRTASNQPCNLQQVMSVPSLVM